MSRHSILEELRQRALKALSKPALYGIDLDVLEFLEGVSSFEKIEQEILVKRAEEVGIDLTARNVGGMYYQRDNRIELVKSLVSGVEIMPLEQAVEERWDELKDLFWRLVPVDQDKYTAITYLKGVGGHYIRVKKNTRVSIPVQACFFMTGGAQLVHNIVFLEEGSELILVTGCTIMPEAMGLHVGVSEIYLSKNAKLIDVTVHSWSRVSHVRPRTSIVLEEGASYIGYYINMSRTKTLQSLPVIEAKGDNSSVFHSSIILGLEDSYHDIGALVRLKGAQSSAELVSRIIARDSSRVVNRLIVEGLSTKVRGYVECNALLLSDIAKVETIPQLLAHSSSAELHHEASIGRLREDEIQYLMMKGFSYRDAVSFLIRGFVEVKLDFLPHHLRKSIDQVLDMVATRSSA